MSFLNLVVALRTNLLNGVPFDQCTGKGTKSRRCCKGRVGKRVGDVIRTIMCICVCDGFREV